MLYLSSHSAGGAPSAELIQVSISIKEAPYSAVGDGIADDGPAVRAAIAAAITQGRPVFVPEGVFLVGRDGSNNWSIGLDGISNLRIFGIPGRSVLKHPDDAAGTGTSLQLYTMLGCTNIHTSGITFDGNWGNGVVYLKKEVGEFRTFVDLAALAANELPYEGDSSAFPASGTLICVNDAGVTQTLTYTGKTADKFTNVSPGVGELKAGQQILAFDKDQGATTIAAGSDGLSLPQATINVVDTTKFPASSAVPNVVQVFTGAGWQSITYTGKTPTTLTGCAGGTGTMTLGGAVTYVDGAGNQIGAPPQVDPKNYLAFIRGSDGNIRRPNKQIVFEDCDFVNAYGDCVWLGAWTEDVVIRNCRGRVTARNGITLSSFIKGVTIDGCNFNEIFTSALDSEPVDAPVQDVTITNSTFGPWVIPKDIVMSLQGGVVGRAAEWNYIRNVRVTNCKINGPVLITNAKDVVVTKNEIRVDYPNSLVSPLKITMNCQGVVCEDNAVYARHTPTDRLNYGVISLSRWPMGVNSAAQPGDVAVRHNRVYARNNTDGIYVEAVGGYEGYAGTALTYTPPAGPTTNGTITVSGTPWSAQLDYWLGHQIRMGGKVANIVGNTADTLSISPLYEFYTSGLAWADEQGRPTSAPAAGPFEILATGGRTEIVGNKIDCRNADGWGNGRYGINLDTTTTWDFGYNDGRLSVRDNDVRGAIRGVNVNVEAGTSAPTKELEVVNNKAWDDQVPPVATHNLYFTNSNLITLLTVHGNTQEGSIIPVTGLTGVWRQSDSWPGSYAGDVDPNGLIFAPPTATYQHLAANAVYVKESAVEFNSGWNPLVGGIRAGIRSIGASVTGAGSLNMAGSMPSTVIGDVELLFISTTYSGAAGSDATLSTPAGFVKKASNTSNFGPDTLVTRCAVWWRRRKATDVAPVIADSGDFNTAVVVAIKDAITSGDPFGLTPVGSQNNGTSQAVTLTGGTFVENDSLLLAPLAWFSSGATNSVNAWANADPDLVEQYEAFDRGVTVGSDRIGLALYTGRVPTAAAIGNTTATHQAENYAVWSGLVFEIKSARVPTRATGLITCTTQANYVDTDYMTLGDGFALPREFEFDSVGDGVTVGRVQVNVSTDTTAAQVAARLRTAILATFAALDVTDNGDGTLSLVNRWPGTGGNIAMSENVANAGHTVSGMSGGQG